MVAMAESFKWVRLNQKKMTKADKIVKNKKNLTFRQKFMDVMSTTFY